MVCMLCCTIFPYFLFSLVVLIDIMLKSIKGLPEEEIEGAYNSEYTDDQIRCT